MNPEPLQTTVCVAGGGPAGVMLGYLLARSGVRVTVLEKHKDFFRDFRGDTVHPSTLEVFHELGLLGEFLKLPHQQVESAGGTYGEFDFQAADFRQVPARCKFVALLPQWDFLKFLSERARRFPKFDLRLEHQVVDLLRQDGRVTGVRARVPQSDTPVDLRAELVVGCDGRHSAVRQAAGLELIESGVPIDVLWFRISRRPGDPEQVLGHLNHGKALILIDRSHYFQAGLIIAKGSYPEVQQRGMAAFHESILQLAPFFRYRIGELRDWDQVQILTVQINRLRRWYAPGVLCLGDAAHAMSPAGGVGINLAVQDAVAAANLLALPLREGRLTERDLARVQQRREFPARVTQAVQIFVHRAMQHAFDNPGPLQAPWLLKAAVRAPGIHHVLGYAVGMGVRPEHVEDANRPARDPLYPWAIGIGTALGVAAGVLVRHAKIVMASECKPRSWRSFWPRSSASSIPVSSGPPEDWVDGSGLSLRS